jgi:basic membrane protein A and related proteins
VRGTLLAGTAIALAALPFAPAHAAEAQPAILYNLVKFDKSFNESAYDGAERFKKETGGAYAEFEVKNDTEREQALRRFAKAGNTPVIAIGFPFAAAVETVAKEFPQTQFVIVDMVVPAPNVQSVVFRYHEGAYLAGLLAAKASKTGTVGAVGGMDIPIIQQFLCGYAQGAKAARPDVNVLRATAGSTPAAFTDPARGAEIAKSQIGQGADVVIQAAGATGLGVLQAAADAGKLGIGTDSNQNGLHPGKVLTSVRKRIDNAVFEAMQSSKAGTFQPGIRALGLKEGGVDLAMDDVNKPLIDAATSDAVSKASADIVAGTLVVHDFMSDSKCPIQ